MAATDLNLESIERRLETVLRDLRAYRSERERADSDKGVLGGRGLTEFVLTLIIATRAISTRQLLTAANQAGYAIPTVRTMSKRLTERAYRVGDIKFDQRLDGWVSSQVAPKGDHQS